MSVLLVFILGGLLTFAMRFSFIYLMGRVALPAYARSVLRFVPAAVLAAIITPEVLLHSGRLDLSLGNSYLVAGTVAVIAALWIRNTLITIVIGMGVLVLLQLL
jgi:branched-subunit amino acid transport protein